MQKQLLNTIPNRKLKILVNNLELLINNDNTQN